MDETAKDVAAGRVSRREWLLMRSTLTARMEAARAVVMQDRYDTAVADFVGKPRLLHEVWGTLLAPLRWPFVQYEFKAEQTAGRTPTEFCHQEFLVARNPAPSFRSVRFAINEFFFGIENDTGYALELLVRIART